MIKRRIGTGLVSLTVTSLLLAACGHASGSTVDKASPSSASASTAASGPTSSGGSSSSPGITSTQVTVGNVSVLGGPVPGLFQGAPDGVEAYFAYVNSQGGVNGRKIVLKSADDSYSCAQNLSQTQSLSSQVFAFVGDFSVFDSCGGQVFQKNPSIPDVSVVLTPSMLELPNVFAIYPQPPGSMEGFYKWVRQTYPSAVKIGTLVTNNPGAEAAWNDEATMLKSLGFQVAYERNYAATETDFTSDVIRMRNAGVQFLEMREADVATFARVMNSAQQQGWHPTVVDSSTAYDPAFDKLIHPGAGNGVMVDQVFAPYLGGVNAPEPAVRQFTQWLNKTAPGFQPNLYAASGWTAAELFVQGLKAAGANPTQQSLEAALKKITAFNGDGMISTEDPATNGPATCWVALQYQNGSWTRRTPSSGFRCQPGGYYYANSSSTQGG